MKNLKFNFKKNLFVLGIILLAEMGCFTSFAQTNDSIGSTSKEKELKNVIRFNITNWLVYDKSYQFSYERLIKKNRTISVFLGYQEFPLDLRLNLDNVELSRSTKKSGYVIGFDYRFYLQKENKFDAPHGVYLAPYMSYNHFNTDREILYTNTSASSNLNTQINILNFGGTLGYQFVIRKRWVIDAVVFGPAVSSYEFKAKLKSEAPGETDDEVIQAVIDALKEKFPFLNSISEGKEVSKSGREAFWSGGFRYNISIGYRF